MRTIFEIMQEVKMSEPTFKTYKVMYKFGAWVTKATFAAENDTEAIHDADEIFNASGLQNWAHGVALFSGNKMIKQYR